MMNTVDMNNNNKKKIRSLITNHVVRWLTDDSRVRFRLIIFRSYELRAGRFVQGGNLPRLQARLENNSLYSISV